MSNVIEYITIASTGNAQDFGDLLSSNRYFCGTSSATRGLFMGHGDSGTLNRIQYITIASTGDAQDFGDLTVGRYFQAATASSTRALCGGGRNGGTYYNVIDYVTIASTGNATDFGDLVTYKMDHGAASDKTTAVFAGGRGNADGSSAPTIKSIDAVTIATTGNASDFGDLNSSNSYANSGTSNAHGGIA